MKPFQIAFWGAALAGIIFFYQLNQIGHLQEEAAVLNAQIDQHNSFSANTGSFVRAFFDGLTLGAYADDGIFTEAKKSEHETTQLKMQCASLISRYETVTFYRNVSVILMIGALIVGFLLKRKSSFQTR